MNANPETNGDKDALKVRYEEVTSCIWNGFNMYFKIFSLILAVVGVGLGYLFKVPLEETQGRLLSGIVVLMLILWYICSVWALMFYSTILKLICSAAEDLHITFDPRQYVICKVVFIASMLLFFPISAGFAYFTVTPPTVQNPLPQESEAANQGLDLLP